MTGGDGTDRLTASLAPDEAAAAGAPGGLGLDLRLEATKPPAFHDRDGWIDFGDAGGSYYYSRTAMAATGTLIVDGRTLQVEGTAWFDHQWGDFISVGGGGWDWFAVNLADGTDLTLSLVRDADGSYPLVYGTLVDRAGATRHLERDAFTVTVDRPLDEPGDRRRLPGRLDDLGAVGVARDRPRADGRRPGARHARDDRRRLLGGIAAGHGDPGGPAGRRSGVCRADGVRAGALTGRGLAEEAPRADGRRLTSRGSSCAGPPTGVRSTFGNDTLAVAARSRDAASSAVSPCRTLSILREVSRYADLSDSESRRPSWAIARTWS